MNTLEYFEMGNKVAKKLNWSKTNLYIYTNGWWCKRHIPFITEINYN